MALQVVYHFTTGTALVFCSAEMLPVQSKAQNSAGTRRASQHKSHIKHPSKSTRGTNPANTLRPLTVSKRRSKILKSPAEHESY